jgi:hypothetical protein
MSDRKRFPDAHCDLDIYVTLWRFVFGGTEPGQAHYALMPLIRQEKSIAENRQQQACQA